MTSPRRPLVPSVLLIAGAFLVACGGDDDDPDAGGGSAEAGETVVLERSRFAPSTVEVGAGAEVTFENADPYAHTVTSSEGSALAFDSGQLEQDETFVQAFAEPGTYELFCEIHPTMRAEVVVS